MSSNQPINIQDHNLGYLELAEVDDIVKGIESATDALSKIKSVLVSTQKAVSPFLSLLQSDPLSTALKQIAKLISDTIASILSTGASFIYINPFNVKPRRHLNLKWNILNPVDQAKQTLEGVKNLSNDAFSYTDKVINIIDLKVPKLSPKESLNELINSFSNTQDKYRPTWNNLTYTCGMGVIVCAQTQAEFINNLEYFNKLFRLTEISKSLKEVRDIFTTRNKMSKETLQQQQEVKKVSTLINDVKNTYGIVKNNSIPFARDLFIKQMEALKEVFLEDYKNSIFDDVPEWKSLSLSLIPFFNDTKNYLDKLLENFVALSKTSEDILTELINAFVTKLNYLITFISDGIELLQTISELEFGLNAFSFVINPNKSSKGVSYITNSLSQISEFSGDLFNSKKNTHISTSTVNDLINSEFSFLFFVGVGFTDFNKAQEELNKIIKLFNVKLSTALQTSTDNTTMNITAKPNFTSLDILVNYKPFVTTLSFSPPIDAYEYSLTGIGTSGYKKIISKRSLGSNSSLTISYSDLPDLESFKLEVTGYSSSLLKEITKKYYFSTDYSMLINATTINSNGIIENIPPNIETYLDTPSITLTNSTREDFSLIVETDDGNIPLNLTKQGSLEIPAYGTGPFNLNVKNNIGKVLNFKTNIYKNFSKLTSLNLRTKKVYIKSEPYPIFISSLIGDTFLIYNSNWIQYSLPTIISLNTGKYLCRILKNGVWGEEFELQVILTTDPNDFCLDLF